MISEVITSVVGLIAGLLTGFYFERRSTKAAIAQNEELKRQLRELRESVYSVGHNPSTASATRAPGDLLSDVLTWACTVQDPSGRVSRAQLIAHFVTQGYATSEVEDALARLSAAGSIRLPDRWVEIT